MEQKLTNSQGNISSEKLDEAAINGKDIAADNSTMSIFAVASQDKTFYDGSYHQFSGHIRTAVFTIGIKKDRLDAPVKRVGFMGIDNNDQPIQIEVGPEAEYNNGLWDIEFELYVYIMGERFHRIKGSFYVETTNNTYYWLKYKNSVDFEFDSYSRLMLCDLQ